MVEGIEDRLDRIFKLTPRRFHISDNPPFGVGLVLCGQVNGDAEDSEQFFLQHGGIPNCKPGIWTSMRRRIPNPFKDDTHTEYGVECILRWVEPGTIDISQPVEEWEAYEKATRDADAQVRPSQFVPQGTSWRRTGKCFDDGGVCTVVSTEYLTAEAAEKMNSGEDEDFSYDGYIEQLSLHGVDGGDADNQGFTIGGMNFYQDEVGAPPYIAVAEEDGKVIAVRIHFGNEDDEEGRSGETEDGLTSSDENEE